MVANSNNTSENIEQDKKINKDDLMKIFLKDFLLEKDLKNNPSFVNGIMNSKSIDKDLTDEMELYKGKFSSKFSGLELEKIKISDLKYSITGDYLKLKTTKNLFLAEVKKTFVVDNDKKILDIIENLTVEKLFSYINSPKNLENFLKDNIPEIKSIEVTKIFSNIQELTHEDIEKKLEGKNPHQKDEIMFILNKIKNNTYNDSDIRGLFDYNILSVEGKKNLIDAYIPVISLSRALEIGLIDKQKANEIKEKTFEEFKDNKINDETFKEIKKYVSFDDIVLQTKDLYKDFPHNLSAEAKSKLLNENLNLLANGIGFKNLEQNSSTLRNEVLENIKQNGPQTFNDLQIGLNEINTNARFKNLEKFKDGNVIKYITKDSENNNVVTFLEISRIDNDKNEFYFKEIGKGSNVSLKNTVKHEEKMSYVAFLEGLKKVSHINLECLLYDDIRMEIKKGNLKQNEFENISSTDLNEETKENFKAQLKLEIDDLDHDILVISDENVKKQKQKLLDEKKEKLRLYDNSSDLDVLKIINKQRFIEKLDEIDPEGRNIGFLKGTFFQAEGAIYEVIGFGYTVTLKHTLSGSEEYNISLEDFVTTFREKKAKRIEKLTDFSSLMEKSLNDKDTKGHEKWHKHAIKDGKIVANGVKSGDKTGNQVVDYLVGDKTNELIKINNINGNQVTVQFGERKDFSSLGTDEKKKNKIGKDSKGEKISLEDKEYTISLHDLAILIKKDGLYPSWKTGKKIEPESIKESENNFHINIFSKFFRGTSFKELMMGGKMLIDGIEETLKKGNDLHAAEFAMKLGKFLPKDLSEDMKVKVERAQQEQQDKELENLGKVDSWIAVERIERWLLNKDTAEHKKEAGLLFMLEKYGHLTAKTALYKYRGKWLWYEAFGGKINDKLFLEVQAESEASDITFSEEYLVHILLKKQCKDGNPPPKRRSRLHKEYENKWKTGITAEFDKGYGDAERKRTAEDIVKGGNDEAMGGTTSNAIGWYKKAVERGGTLEEMSEGFFALLFSGALYDVDQATFLKIKALWEADGNPMIMTRFSTTKSEMMLFNKAVVEICGYIEESEYPGHKGIKKEAKELFDDALNSKGSEKERFQRTIDFWHKHGTPVVRALNMVNVKDNKYSKTDKIVLLEKENNETLNNYYNKVRGFTSLDGAFGKGFMDEDCGEVGITGLNVYELTKKYLYIDQTMAFREKKTGPIIWKEISEDVNSINSKTFDEDPVQDKIKKQKYLVHILRDLAAAIFSVVGKDRMSPYNDGSKNIGQDFNKWGLHLRDDLGNFSVNDIHDGKNEDVNKILLKVANNIISGTSSKGGSNPLDELKSSTKKSADSTLGQKPYPY